jgi:hypothetical protein
MRALPCSVFAVLFRKGARHSACVPCFRSVVVHLVSCDSGDFTESEIAKSNEIPPVRLSKTVMPQLTSPTSSESSVTKQRCSILALIHPEPVQLDPDR